MENQYQQSLIYLEVSRIQAAPTKKSYGINALAKCLQVQVSRVVRMYARCVCFVECLLDGEERYVYVEVCVCFVVCMVYTHTIIY